MKISFDPVVASRIKQAWGNLNTDQQRTILPMVVKAHQQAVTIAQTKQPPPPDPTVNHNLLLTHSALTADRDDVLNSFEAGVVVDIGPAGEIWGTGTYQQLDPGWTEAAAVWLENLFAAKYPFPNNPPVIAIPDSVQIGLVGDWGTGDWRTARNPAPSTDVGRHLAFLQTHINIHLGDVYYAGSAEEEQHLLVDLWPAGSLGSLTLNSNHEMYSGGAPYFNVALASPKFAMQKGSSFFALENKFWVIVGLDSAYFSSEPGMYMDGALASTQVGFLRAQAAKGKKVIVLTHHNGLSDDGSTTNSLWDQVMSAFPVNVGPADWYWGHVHAGVVYQNHDPQGRNVACRCCGHGALPWGPAPVFNNPANVLWYEKRSASDPDIPQRVLNGFAVLYLDGPNFIEVFYDENGGVAWP